MPTTHTVDCNAGEKIQDKVAAARPGDTITGGRDGIHLDHTSVGRIGGNTIADVHACGIDVAEMSVTRVGCAARLT